MALAHNGNHLVARLFQLGFNLQHATPPLTHPESKAEPFEELYTQGVAQYLGQFTPMTSETAGHIVQHTLGARDGPLCLTGAEYTMA